MITLKSFWNYYKYLPKFLYRSVTRNGWVPYRNYDNLFIDMQLHKKTGHKSDFWHQYFHFVYHHQLVAEFLATETHLKDWNSEYENTYIGSLDCDKFVEERAQFDIKRLKKLLKDYEDKTEKRNEKPVNKFDPNIDYSSLDGIMPLEPFVNSSDTSNSQD
jgi:hypothetical protein